MSITPSMANEISDNSDRMATELLDGIYNDSAQFNTLVTGDNKDKKTIAEQLALNVVHKPGMQVALFRAIIGILSQETEDVDVDKRDATVALLQQPALVDFFPQHQETLFSAYCEALNRQTSNNDPFSGPVGHLLEAGIFLSPYFSQDDLTKKQLEHLLRQVAGQFDRTEQEHIAGYISDIFERMTFLGARDARVLFWREQKLKNKEIAEKLNVKDHVIEQSVSRLILDGKLSSRHEIIGTNLLSAVKELRNQGLTNARIADKLDVSQRTIQEAARQLLSKKEIDARLSKSLSLSDIDIDTRVEPLMRSGMKPRHIIALLPGSKSEIERSILRVRRKLREERIE